MAAGAVTIVATHAEEEMNTTKIGIIGLGFMGRMHFDTYEKIPEANVMAVCDSDARRASGDLSGGWGNLAGAQTTRLPMDRIKGYTDLAQFLANPEIEVVDICLPTPAHVQVVTAALAAGKHVICEKPLALNSTEARQIADAAAVSSSTIRDKASRHSG